MKMFLHNIGEMVGISPISPNEAPVASSPETYDYVFATPPVIPLWQEKLDELHQ